MNINARKNALTGIFLALLCSFIFSANGFCASVAEITAIGRIESIYRNRVTMRILEIISPGTLDVGLATGSWVSFDLPQKNKRSKDLRIKYGTIIEAALIGNVMTEYEIGFEPKKADQTKPSEAESELNEGESSLEPSKTEKEVKPTSAVLLWTAQSVTRVKNQRKYSEKKNAEKHKRNKKEKAPIKIYTQKETVRGQVKLNRDKVYIKEDRMRKKDKGLLIISENWLERFKSLVGRRVVIHGISHRTSISSGTLEIENVLKVYPK